MIAGITSLPGFGGLPSPAAMVDHYNNFFGLGLSSSQKSDLIEFT